MEGLPYKDIPPCTDAESEIDRSLLANSDTETPPIETTPPLSRRRLILRQLKSPWLIGSALGTIGLLLVAGFSILGGCQSGGKAGIPVSHGAWRPAPLPTPVKAVWVARFHYRYPDDIRIIMRNCAAAGCNTVLWQVRGEGTVAYPSHIEPWSAQYQYSDPGYDPLQIAVAEAHRNGLRIEAWVNVMPGWKGSKPPPIGNQLWNAHPEWFLHDAAGQRQPLGDFYVILNPCLPEVRRYISGVVRELMTNYQLDGIHMDYVRYAWDTTPGARENYPRDPVTLRLYQQETSRRPDQDVRAWDRWRAAQLTRLVTDIRAAVSQARPGATLTAAVWSSSVSGYRDYFQDSPTWLRDGLVDALMPMAYTESLSRFEQNISEYRAAVPRGRIVPGIGLYKHDTPEPTRQQLQRCRNWGGDFALFSYESLHATAADRGGVDPRAQQLRRMRLATVNGR